MEMNFSTGESKQSKLEPLPDPSSQDPSSTERAPQRPDVLIVGAGVIGLTLALELKAAGAQVALLDPALDHAGASRAAAGMLAVNDPHNPPALHELARYSRSLYPSLLKRIEELSGEAVPFQTHTTLQYTANGSPQELGEESLDPRQLMQALRSAVSRAGVPSFRDAALVRSPQPGRQWPPRLHSGTRPDAGQVVWTAGAWSGLRNMPVRPLKGQMLRVAMPQAGQLTRVHRAEHVYVVPRTAGNQAGSALVGATLEDAGFDTVLDPAQLQQLRVMGAALAPETAFVRDAPELEAWAGLRPCTPDDLPLLGALGKREWVATGHYRNGILLAPGTARVLVTLLAGQTPAISLEPFSPLRFLRP